MKIKVKAECEDKNGEFKVRRMTYDNVIVNYPYGNGLKEFEYNDIELISEGVIDEFLIDNMEFLKIKLNRGISVFFYQALKDSLEEELNEELNDLNLLRDKYSVNRRAIWEKEIIAVINKKLPIKVLASGHNFKREGYSINVIPLKLDEFFKASEEQMGKIKKEIKRKELSLNSYEKAIEDLKKSSVDDTSILLK